MTAISPQLHNSGYYQLNNASGSGSGSANNARGAAPAPSLAGALGGGKAAGAGYSDAVLVDLSPEAQKYLSGLNAQKAMESDSFVLSAKQRLALSNVLEQYKDEPYTQATFDKIQDELQGLGLSPEQLSAKDRVRSFSATAVLVDALSGGKGTTPGSQPISDEALQKKSANYMQEVVNQWKKISTDYQSKQNADAVSAVSEAENG